MCGLRCLMFAYLNIAAGLLRHLSIQLGLKRARDTLSSMKGEATSTSSFKGVLPFRCKKVGSPLLYSLVMSRLWNLLGGGVVRGGTSCGYAPTCYR